MKQWIEQLNWVEPVYLQEPSEYEYDSERHCAIQRIDIHQVELEEHEDLNQSTGWTCKERIIPDDIYNLVTTEIDTVLDNELMAGQTDIMDGMADIYMTLETIAGGDV